MNGMIAAQIATQAMREQFNYGDDHSGDHPNPRHKRAARPSRFARLLRSLAARLVRRSHRPKQEAWEAR